ILANSCCRSGRSGSTSLPGSRLVSRDGREWRASWGEGDRSVPVGDELHLRRLLAEADEEARRGSFTVFALFSPGGSRCTIGLGRDLSVATFEEVNAPPYWIS